MRLRKLLLRVLLSGWCAGPLQAEWKPTGLNPMVPMFHRWDYPKVPERLARVAESGAGRVSFTVLMLAELDPDFRVNSYGAVRPRESAGDGAESAYQALSPAMRESIRSSLARLRLVTAAVGMELMSQVISGDLSGWRGILPVFARRNGPML